MRKSSFFGWMVVMGVLLAAGGCGSPTAKELPKAPPSPAASQEQNLKADKTSSEAVSAAPGAEVPEGLKELSAEDRAAAEKQRICPVGGDLLGLMGKPYKIKVQDRTVFLCCQGCEDAIRENPGKYLAKLNPGQTKP